MNANGKVKTYKNYGKQQLFHLSHQELESFLQYGELELGDKTPSIYSKYQPGDKVAVAAPEVSSPWRWRDVTAVKSDRLCVKAPLERESYWVSEDRLKYWSPYDRTQDENSLFLFFYHSKSWETTVGFLAVGLGKQGMLINQCHECSGTLLVTDIDRTPLFDKSPKELWKHARHVERLCDRIGRLLVQI